MKYFSSDFKLGILGGGQLGKMLLSETRKYDVYTKVLDPSMECPSRISSNEFVCGDLLDYDTVYSFGKDVDVLTIEIEKVNLDALEQLEKEGVKVFPNAKTLKSIQSKGIQKEFYKKNNITTSDFKVFDNIDLLTEDVQNGLISMPFVWKCTRFGYDGNGVKIVKTISDLDNLPNVECLAEDLVNFKNELAVIVSRSESGEVKEYPVVEMEFHPEANQVEYVICPARIDEDITNKARALARKVSEAYEHVGLLAVEMFETHDGEIIVNEVAPRPHNSGHYSIEGSITSQFEQHLRAILNLPLGSTETKLPAVMVNLVGAEGYTGQVVYQNIDKVLKLEGVTPHIYGKRETRPFRKMGHVTIVNKDMNKAREIAQEVKEQLKVISE